MKAFSRVVVLDDQRKHLDIIVRALGRAGYAAIPYLADEGTIKPRVTEPCSGLRLIFSDIHLTPYSGISGLDNIGILGPFLKKITPDGPYGLIFWSKFSEDEKEIVQTLKDRIDDLGFQLPAFFGFIDKKLVLTDVGDDAQEVEEKDPEEFRVAIRREIEKSPALMTIMEWEERAFLATNYTSNSLYKLSADVDPSTQAERLLNLISYLAQETVGKTAALSDPLRALDNAMLPVLEDQFRHSLAPGGSQVKDILSGKLSGKKLSLPAGVSPAKLHTFYLVENLKGKNAENYTRGTVSTIESKEVDTIINKLFETKWRSLLLDEFICSGKDRSVYEAARNAKQIENEIRPCLISLSAECDDVQGKVVTHRYLLGVIADTRNLEYLEHQGSLARGALHKIGIIEDDGNELVLIASCRRFVAMPTISAKTLAVIPKFRLRKATVEELSHQYTTYARRPGVMRFS